MIDAALPYLRCPVCADTLSRPDARTLRCARGHAFDLARQGYASLTTGRTPHSGDTAEMIAARESFLAAGHYAFIADALSGAATELRPGPPGLILDAGVGTGYYLARLLDAWPSAAGLGLDVSKPALRRAARAHPRAAAVLADLWRPLPLADAAAALILNVFAPRNGPEFRRVLRPGGALLVVTPAAGHLRELIDAYGLIHVDPDKAERVSGSLGAHFTAAGTTTHERRLRLTGDEVRTLIGMTPSARHIALDDLPKDDFEVTTAVDVTAYRPATAI
jgi:23S rRNA (guanine745-N1)-methyltransferase